VGAMKVKELMTKKVKTISPSEGMDRVFLIINYENIRHLPVMDEGKLVGMVSDSDFKKVHGSPKFLVQPDGTTFTVSSRKVEGIMQKKVITIEPNQKAHEAAAIMVKKKIGALPVVHKGKLKGIITATDILKAFVKLGSELESVNLKPLVHTLENWNADEKSKS
jgi:acetoin utilization protein AcuB